MPQAIVNGRLGRIRLDAVVDYGHSVHGGVALILSSGREIIVECPPTDEVMAAYNAAINANRENQQKWREDKTAALVAWQEECRQIELQWLGDCAIAIADGQPMPPEPELPQAPEPPPAPALIEVPAIDGPAKQLLVDLDAYYASTPGP